MKIPSASCLVVAAVAAVVALLPSCTIAPSVYRKHDLKAGELRGTVQVFVQDKSPPAAADKVLAADLESRFAKLGLASGGAESGWTLRANHHCKPYSPPPGPDGVIPPTPSALKNAYEHSLTLFLFEKPKLDPRWGASTTLLLPHNRQAEVLPQLLDAAFGDFPGTSAP